MINEKQYLLAKKKLLEIRIKDAKYREENKVEFVEFLPHQQKILDFFKEEKKTILMVTGNRGGKCCTYRTKIETPSGEIEIGKLYDKGEPFQVYAWDGNKKVIRQASAPFKKEGLHDCYRIEMSDGRFIEAADHHKILTVSGRYTSVCDLQGFFGALHESSLGICPSVHALGDQSFYQRPVDYRDDCSGDFRQYDGQFLSDRDTDLIFAPLQDDVQRHNAVLCNEDVQDNKYIDTPYTSLVHPSSTDVTCRNVGQSVECLIAFACKPSQLLMDADQSARQPSTVAFSESLSTDEFDLHKDDISFSALLSPLCIGGNFIISYTFIGSQYVYDFEVEEYHNYFAGGLIHHNTTLGAIIVALLCVPELREKKGMQWLDDTFPRKGGSIRILCKDWEHFAAQVMVPALKEWLPAGTYETKKNNVGIEAFWKFSKSGWTIEFITNVQATENQEGWKGNFVWQDETTTRDKYVTNKRGLIDYSGVYLMTFTAVDTSWVLDDIVLSGDTNIGYLGGITTYENTYLNTDDIKAYEKTLTDTERKSRIMGNFLNFEGRVWKNFDKNVHTVKPFKVPPDWPVTFQIDWHLNVEQAISFMTVNQYGQRFIVAEVWDHLTAEEVADEIIRLKKQHGWRLERGEIDKISRGDAAYVRNRMGHVEDSFITVENKLKKYEIQLGVGSSDEKSYVNAVEGWFKGINGPPLLFIFNDCIETIRQVERWIYDTNGKPSSTGHFPECIGRFSQMGLKYSDPLDWSRPIRKILAPV